MEDDGMLLHRFDLICMDIHGKVVLVKDVFGCKLTHHITHPDMYLLVDEVGGNTNQQGGSYFGVNCSCVRLDSHLNRSLAQNKNLCNAWNYCH